MRGLINWRVCSLFECESILSLSELRLKDFELAVMIFRVMKELKFVIAKILNIKVVNSVLNL